MDQDRHNQALEGIACYARKPFSAIVMKIGNLITVSVFTFCAFTQAHARSTTYGLAIADIQNLSNGVELFQSDYGQYPPPKNWWAELTGLPAAEVNKNGKVYVDIFEEKDPWGSEYRYNLLDMGSEKLPMVYSLGKDKKSETFGHDADDISSWRDYKIPLSHYQPPFFTMRKLTIGTIAGLGYVCLLLYLRSKRIPEKNDA